MYSLSSKHIETFKDSVKTKQYDLLIEKTSKKIEETENLLIKSISKKYMNLIDTFKILKDIKKPISELKIINSNISIKFQESLLKIVNQKSEIKNYENILDKINKSIYITQKLKSFYESVMKMEENDFYKRLKNLKILEVNSCYFKNYRFYFTLKSIYEYHLAIFSRELYEKSKKWIDDAQEVYEYVGSKEIPDSLLLFDNRFDFKQFFNMKDFQILFYISKKLNHKEEFIEIINKKRFEYIQKFDINENISTAIKKFYGFFILEFYLSNISKNFDIKHHSFIKKIIEIEAKTRNSNFNILKIKRFYLGIINFLYRFDFETVHLEDELKNTCIEFLYGNQIENENFTVKIQDYIDQCKELAKGIEFLDINDIVYKSIDDKIKNYLIESQESGLVFINKINISEINSDFQWKYKEIENEIIEEIKMNEYSEFEDEIIKFIEKYPKNKEFGEFMESRLKKMNDDITEKEYIKKIIYQILIGIKNKLKDQQNISKSSELLFRTVSGNLAIFENFIRNDYEGLKQVYEFEK